MGIKTYFSELLAELDTLLEEGVIGGRDDPDELEDGPYTMLTNLANYNVARKNGLTLIPQNLTANAGFSDILLCTESGPVIEIEHENRPLSKRNGIFALEKSLNNLLGSSAIYKVLITYSYSDCSLEYIRTLCENHLNKSNVSCNSFFLFCAPYDFDSAVDQFMMIQLG